MVVNIVCSGDLCSMRVLFQHNKIQYKVVTIFKDLIFIVSRKILLFFSCIFSRILLAFSLRGFKCNALANIYLSIYNASHTQNSSTTGKECKSPMRARHAFPPPHLQYASRLQIPPPTTRRLAYAR